MISFENMSCHTSRFHTTITIILNIHWSSTKIETFPSRLKDCRSLQRCVDRSERPVIVIRRLCCSGINIATCINEILEGSNSITTLTRKHTISGGVFHEERIHGRVSITIGRHTCASMSLIDADFTLRTHKTTAQYK